MVHHEGVMKIQYRYFVNITPYSDNSLYTYTLYEYKDYLYVRGWRQNVREGRIYYEYGKR